MIISSPGFTGTMNPSPFTYDLTDRQLFPGYPIATTQGAIVTPTEMGWSGMAGIPGETLSKLVAIVGILALLWWLSRDGGDRE